MTYLYIVPASDAVPSENRGPWFVTTLNDPNTGRFIFRIDADDPHAVPEYVHDDGTVVPVGHSWTRDKVQENVAKGIWHTLEFNPFDCETKDPEEVLEDISKHIGITT